jgi:GntR family transcriptional regulator
LQTISRIHGPFPTGGGAVPPGDRALAPDYQALGPAAEEVRHRILDEIASGVLRPGERLGAERDLARRYRVSRSTLRGALAELESSGAVRRVTGRAGGTFVAERRVERDLTTVAGLPAYLRRQGFQPGARVLSTRTLQAKDEISVGLGLAPGAVVFEIVRTRLADEEPISLEHAYLPADRFPGLLDKPLGGLLYPMLQTDYGLIPGEAEERIEVVGASENAARVLGVRRSAPLVSIERHTVDADGVPFELSHDLFRADRVRIVVRAQADRSTAGVVGGSIEIAPAGAK